MNETIINAKAAVVTEISEKMKNATSSVVVEYRGLSVTEITELRVLLRAEGVDFKVYKNALARRAASINGMDELNADLTGPNAIAFSSDAVAPARVLAKFAKTHDKLVVKSGYVEGKFADSTVIESLSKLPNREGMIAMLLGCLQSPVRQFACTVKAVADAKVSE
ncbi:MAG: 50S ribosomal protein L10 [Erysipelotrichaceae bacterium]